jgi:hypothetical protein
VLSWTGEPLRQADLADFLKDRDWVVRSRELFEPGDALSEEPPEDDDEGGAGASPSEVAAGDVFEVLGLRAQALGDAYPFVVTDTRLELRVPLTPTHMAYLALLAITIAHHYDVDCEVVPERLFEECVAQAMALRGLRTVDTAAAGRGEGRFAELVVNVGDAVGLIGAPASAAYRTHANEEGVDTVSHLSWGDQRAGHWVFIGQATCAKSNEWARKIQEPRPEQWASLITSVVPPIGYLAVPHHVEDEQLSNLSRNHGRLVLDRLRLSRHLGSLSERQHAMVTAVQTASVYHPLE